MRLLLSKKEIPYHMKSKNFFCILKVTAERSRIRIPRSESATKCHGSPTLLFGNTLLCKKKGRTKTLPLLVGSRTKPHLQPGLVQALTKNARSGTRRRPRRRRPTNRWRHDVRPAAPPSRQWRVRSNGVPSTAWKWSICRMTTMTLLSSPRLLATRPSRHSHLRRKVYIFFLEYS
jgi:hypothetical protein